MKNNLKFPGSLADIKPDASLYTINEATALYVNHPEGLPNVDRNHLIIGPIGSGKTIMLKSLLSNWQESDKYKPIYFDALKWTSQIAGETETFTSIKMTPNAFVLLKAMSLAIIIGLCESVGAFDEPKRFRSIWKLFEDAFGNDSSKIRIEARNWIFKALTEYKFTKKNLPNVFTVASELGTVIKETESKLLILLVDQIDQVSQNFFTPIMELLRRSGNFISVLATRPCPTAPEPEVMPNGITIYDSYQIIKLGKGENGTIPQSFVLEFIKGLPLKEPYKGEIESRSTLIGNIMWPSLRLAINTIKDYVKIREETNKNPDEVLFKAIHDIGLSYESMVQDRLRAWCSNPKSMLKEWRALIMSEQTSTAPSKRTLLSFSKAELFDINENKQPEQLIRIALKQGILFIGSDEQYIPGIIPTTCEIAPILFVNESNFNLHKFTFDNNTINIDIPRDSLKKWTTSFSRPKKNKQIFISYWMSNPENKKSFIEQVIVKRFESSVEIITGKLEGSPRWSPAIMDKINRVDLVLCDFSIPRKDIFVEYGVAISANKPVIQCFSNKQKSAGFPKWIMDRQNQFFDSTTDEIERFLTSISVYLEQDSKWEWKKDSQGNNLEAPPKLKNIFVIGTNRYEEVFKKIDDLSKQVNLSMEFEILNIDENHLERIIKSTRSAGTLFICLDDSNNDYLCCLSGGLFASKKRGYSESHSIFSRHLFIMDFYKANLKPGLLISCPQAEHCKNENDLLSKFRIRINYIDKILSKF